MFPPEIYALRSLPGPTCVHSRGLRGLKCGSRTRPATSIIDPHPPRKMLIPFNSTRNNPHQPAIIRTRPSSPNIQTF